MNDQLTQPRAIRAYLIAAMRSGEYACCECLPPEKDLSEKLGISRTMLRDVLGALDREGFVTRRHGVGTIINRHVLAVACRMDIEVEFLDMIRESGFEPALAHVSCADGHAEQKIAQVLNIAPGDPVLQVTRLCTADGKPAIYCKDIIPQHLIKEPYTTDDFKSPIFNFLQGRCGISAYLDITDIRPVVADAALAEVFQIQAGAPLLNMEEVDFDHDGKPVFYSDQYFVDGVFRHTVMRKKL